MLWWNFNSNTKRKNRLGEGGTYSFGGAGWGGEFGFFKWGGGLFKLFVIWQRVGRKNKYLVAKWFFARKPKQGLSCRINI